MEEGSYAKLASSSTRVVVLIIPPIPIPIALINVAAAKLTLLYKVLFILISF